MDDMPMDFPLIAFYVFAATAVMSAIGVIGARNPVHSALFLVLTFFTVACTWILAGAEFLGLVLVLVYVGAVMVLFLFVVMMLDVDIVKMRKGYVRYLPVGLVVAVVMLAEMLALIGIRARSVEPFADNAAQVASVEGNTTWLAHALFTDFLLPFEVAAVILTVAVIAAVMLTLRRRVGARHQDPLKQGRVRPSDRLRMVRMDATKPAPPAEETDGDQEAKP